MSSIHRSCRIFSKPARPLLIAALVTACCAGVAHAHAITGTSTAWWDGMLHVYVSPLAWAGVVALAAFLARGAHEESLIGSFAAALLAVLGGLAAFVVPAAPLAASGIALVASAAAWGMTPTRMSAGIAGAIAGFAIAMAATEGEAFTVGMMAGLGLGVIVAGTLLTRIMHWLHALQPIAPRVIAAWAGAISLLMLLLALRN